MWLDKRKYRYDISLVMKIKISYNLEYEQHKQTQIEKDQVHANEWGNVEWKSYDTETYF